MTIEKATEILDGLRKESLTWSSPHSVTALTLGIEALKFIQNCRIDCVRANDLVLLRESFD